MPYPISIYFIRFRHKVGEAGMNLLKASVAEATGEHPSSWREQRLAMIFRLQEESGGDVARKDNPIGIPP